MTHPQVASRIGPRPAVTACVLPDKYRSPDGRAPRPTATHRSMPNSPESGDEYRVHRRASPCLEAEVRRPDSHPTRIICHRVTRGGKSNSVLSAEIAGHDGRAVGRELEPGTDRIDHHRHWCTPKNRSMSRGIEGRGRLGHGRPNGGPISRIPDPEHCIAKDDAHDCQNDQQFDQRDAR
jgi:hypothetical protein